MSKASKYPVDTTEHLIHKELDVLIAKCKEKIYTEEFKKSPKFNTEETNLNALGIIISKYCEWDGEAIKTVAMSAFEDSNFHDAEINL